MDMEFWKIFSINIGNRIGTMCLPWGKDWHWSHEDALVTVRYKVLEMEHAIQTMEGDSVMSPINTCHFSLEGSSHRAVNTMNDSERMRTVARDDEWEHLNDVKIPSKTWDYIGLRRRRSFSDNGDNASVEESTMSGQGEE